MNIKINKLKCLLCFFRVWGGSSSLNAMCGVRGHPEDYNRWESEGADGWAYKNCLPYFKKMETYTGDAVSLLF